MSVVFFVPCYDFEHLSPVTEELLSFLAWVLLYFVPDIGYQAFILANIKEITYKDFYCNVNECTVMYFVHNGPFLQHVT